MPRGPITLQPERHYATEGHRYGVNGKEMDNEVREEASTGTSGTGNHYDYGFRVYDPRIAKFLSVDLLEKRSSSEMQSKLSDTWTLPVRLKLLII